MLEREVNTRRGEGYMGLFEVFKHKETSELSSFMVSSG